ncbi:MAG: hypothetical protein HUU47_01555 [Bacteroidetes bacterium]|nr:hypothetical protein [Bacteroidota bacterium]
MKNITNIIQTQLSPSEIAEKLKSVTITDFTQLRQSPPVSYYGEITSHSFNIKNVRYSPFSATPSLQGEIEGGVNSTTVKVKMDINEYFSITKKMYYSTLIPIGLIVMLLSALVLGGTEYQIHGFLFSCAFIICAFVAVLLTKVSLVNMKNTELKSLTTVLDGKLLEDSYQYKTYNQKDSLKDKIHASTLETKHSLKDVILNLFHEKNLKH